MKDQPIEGKPTQIEGKPTHILIAPNAFKNALTADLAAAAIQGGLARSTLQATSETFPVGDGGDGTGELLLQRMGGQRIEVKARDPFGRMVTTYWGLVKSARPGKALSTTAIIEMANASGLRLLSPTELDPLHASSAGTGDLIRAALDRGVDNIVIGMGGSATIDGGTGILQALGIGFLNSDGQPLRQLPADLDDLDSIDVKGMDPRLAATGLVVLCDVENPLTGADGAAAVFGPQKGAPPQAVRRLEVGLETLARVIARQTGRDIAAVPRGGTAGGAAAGLYGLLSARLVSGIDYFLDLTNFEDALQRSTRVITGEGSIDEQTLQGKAPLGVALRAHNHHLPVAAFAGRLPTDLSPLRPYFDEMIPIGPGAAYPDLATALAHTATDLQRTAMEWADRLAAAPAASDWRMV